MVGPLAERDLAQRRNRERITIVHWQAVQTAVASRTGVGLEAIRSWDHLREVEACDATRPTQTGERVRACR